jgi:sugar lactone lactonase YvrE
MEVAPDGGVWFLEATVDRISVLRGTTITSWQLRPDDQRGANPVDFVLEGNIVWFLESGQSQIPAGSCALGRLDTTTGALTEWVIPGSIPAAFYKDPDGNYWIPISGGSLQKIDLTALSAVNYRSQATFAYADMVVGPDGALWLVDFGNNRIVRYVPDAATETSWTFFDPAFGRLNPAEIRFDDEGFLWIAQLSADRMDRFDPTNNTLASYFGIDNPIHFEFFQGRLYVTSATATASAVSVLDPAVARPAVQILAPQTFDVRTSPSTTAVTVRNSIIVPTTFTTAATPMPADTLDVSGSVTSPGVLTTLLDSIGTYGVTVSGGFVWVGTNGKLVNVTLQSIGGEADVTVPVATSLGGAANNKIRVDLTLSNRGAGALTGDALYLYSPGAFPPRTAFTLAPGATQVILDAFGNVGSGALLNGAVRFRVTTGTATDLVASVRSTRITPEGATFGYELPATPAGENLGPGASATLFTGARDGTREVPVLGMYSPGGSRGVLTLQGADGAIRGVRPFDLAANTREEFNPAASAFGVEAQAGDVVRVAVETGSLQPYVNVVDLGTVDVAAFVPVFAAVDSVLPNAGTLVGAGGRSFVSDLFLSNPDSDAAEISLAFYPLLSSAPLQATVSLAPGTSRAIPDFLPELFGLTSGQGALLVTSNVPVATGMRIAARSTLGDYGGFAPAVPSGITNGSAIAVGLPQVATRWSNLLLYNRGVAGSITVTGFRADGSPAGQVGVEIGNHVATRLNSVFSVLGVADQLGGRIRVDVPAGMNVYAWTADVDGHTADVDLAPLR